MCFHTWIRVEPVDRKESIGGILMEVRYWRYRCLKCGKEKVRT